jgi:hypothetical protein
VPEKVFFFRRDSPWLTSRHIQSRLRDYTAAKQSERRGSRIRCGSGGGGGGGGDPVRRMLLVFYNRKLVDCLGTHLTTSQLPGFGRLVSHGILPMPHRETKRVIYSVLGTV